MLQLYAQKNMRVFGCVTDTAKVGIGGVDVFLIINSDTLRTVTSEDGNYSISKVNLEKFILQLNALGYHRSEITYSLPSLERQRHLDTIVLKKSSRMLKDVVIKAKPNPVRFMQDTVEFNAAAFEVREGDNVADLLKKLPGMEVDNDYNVKTTGREMVKLRVNGVDFFTNNIKDFIGKLPAEIVSKIQVIDHYGEEANFTGVKTGEPVKMMNIVTKPGMNKGKFGGFNANAGTNNMLGSNASLNLWNGSKQSSAHLNTSTFNNGAGDNHSNGGSISNRDKFGKHGNRDINYNFNGNGNTYSSEQVSETLNPEGNFINNSKNDGESRSTNHTLSLGLDFNNNKSFIMASLAAGYNRSDNKNTGLSNQYGVIRQDFRNNNSSNNTSPYLSGNISVSRRSKNKKNSFSINSSVHISGQNNDQTLGTNTIYYDKLTGSLLKDSLLNRDVNSTTNSENATLGLNYSIGLKKTKDTLARRSFNLSYHGYSTRTTNSVSTLVLDNLSRQSTLVDSLSNSFRSISLQQSLGVNYNYSSRKMRYNISFDVKPNLLTNRDFRLKTTTKNNTFNYSPGLNFSKTLSQGKTLSLTYRGSNNNPTLYQLQPIRNAQSLQNIVVGNPDLKPSFTNSLNTNFNYNHSKSGLSIQVGASASSTQREIVSAVSLIADTLNSLKQITRYENVNGNYQTNANYHIHLPLMHRKLSLRYSGTFGFSNRTVLFNNQKISGKGTNFNQQLDGTLSMKKFSVNLNLNYYLTNNNDVSSMYSGFGFQSLGIGQIPSPAFFKTTGIRTRLNGDLRLKNLKVDAGLNYNSSNSNARNGQTRQSIGDLNMNVSSRLTVKKSYFMHFSISKGVRYGYALNNSNPMIINGGIEKSFLKDNALSVKIYGSDLLGQGNNISRMMSGNTIIDSRNVQQTRVFSMNLQYNLSRFGGKHIRVDKD